MELEFQVSTGITTAIYRQIVDQVRCAMAGGTLRTGDRLPSVRALAEQLVINPNTVAKAYGELARDGLIESRAGRGCFIADRREVYSEAERSRRIESALDALVGEALMLGFSPDQVAQALAKRFARFESDSGSTEGTTDG